jgi:hypothetical protein
MLAPPGFTRIKDGFYLVTHPEIRENPWYLTRKHGQGTYAEIANDIEIGVYIAPWPFNRHVVVEQHLDPERRELWDGPEVGGIIMLAYDEIIGQLAGDV